MRFYNQIILCILIFTLHEYVAFGQIQGDPIVKNITTKELNAGPENWSITQDSRGLIYVGNSQGLLQYDGLNWDFFPTHKQSPIRSIEIDCDNKIYVGGLNEIGFFAPDIDGEIVFTSLHALIPKQYLDYTNVWKTIVMQGKVYFISNEYVFVYFKGKIDVIKPSKTFHFAYKIENSIYIIDKGKGLAKINGFKIESVKGGAFYMDEKLYSCFSLNKNELLLCTRTGTYVYNTNSGKSIPFIDKKLNSFLIENEVYGSAKIDRNSVCFNTLNAGSVIYNFSSHSQRIINEKSGLLSNKILSLFFDNQSNIWLGLDNGLSIIKFNSNLLKYGQGCGLSDDEYTNVFGINKLVYTTTKSKLYVGNLNSKKLNFKLIKSDFEQIEKVETDTFLNQEVAFICSHNGLFLLSNGNKINSICDIPSFSVTRSKEYKNSFWLSSEVGLFKLNWNNSSWDIEETSLMNFPVRKVLEYDHKLFVCTFNNGAFSMPLNFENRNQYDAILVNDKDLKNLNYAYPYIFNSELYLSTFNGFIKYNKVTHIFEKASEFKILQSCQLSPLISETENDIVALSINLDGEKELLKLSKNKLEYQIRKSELDFFKNSLVNGFWLDAQKKVWFVTENSLYQFNSSETYLSKPFNCLIRTVKTPNKSLFKGQYCYQSKILFVQNTDLIPRLIYSENNLIFEFAAANYFENDNLQFSYKLQGFDSKYCEYLKTNVASYNNLGEGKYTFYVKAKNVYGVESSIAKFEFEISPPWYRTIWSYLIYILLSILLVYLIIQISISRLKRAKILLEKTVVERTREIVVEKENVEMQKKLVEVKNKDITDSINYAQRIQHAILPEVSDIKKQLNNCFILFKPRDIVSGDFYWYKKINENEFLLACVDCTGHGVPGAFMSMIGNTLLNEIVNQKKIFTPSLMLDELHLSVRLALKQNLETSTNRDGMDIALISYNRQTMELQYAAANRPLFIVDIKGELTEYKADKFAIGGMQNEVREFSNNVILLTKGSKLYMTSDGFADQFGGPLSKKFMVRNFKEMLVSNSNLSMQEQLLKFNEIITQWMAGHEQIDDILLIGFEV